MPDHSIKYMHAVAHATRDHDGQLEYIAAVQDVTARRMSEQELQRVGAEQEALRKAATLVASGAPPTEVFAAISASAAEVFGVPFASLIRVGPDETATMVAACAACSAYVGQSWTVPANDPGITRTVLDSCRPSRIEDHSRVHGPVGEAARALGVGSVVGAPVIVDGSVWGVLAVGAAQNGPPLAPDAADRLANFAELVSTAIVNTEARDQVRRLLDEQAALRRVATLVARGVSPADVFAAVTDEVGGLFGSEAAVARFEPDGSAMVVVGLTKGIPVVSIGTRWPLEDFLASTTVYRTGRPARNDHTGHRNASGSVAENLRKMDFISTVAAPIVVEGNLWGVMTVSDRREPLPPDTEERVAKFTELVATAIANAESRAELAASEARARELASEQAALRRVATLVAEGATPNRVFDAVRHEVARMFNIPSTVLMRFDADGMATLLATYGYYLGPVGTRWPLEGDTSAVARVHQTGRAARADYTRHVHGSLAQAARRGGVRYPVAVPVVVEGALWGAMSAGSYGPEPPPLDLEGRLAKLTELLATAIANAESRADLAASEARARELANEQAALRRVATLVAKGVSADELFAAVAYEVASVVGVPVVGVCRYEADGTFTMLGIAGETTFTIGSRWPVEDEGLAGMILATGRPARKDDYTTMPGPLGAAVRDDRMVATVGVPIVVDGGIWGFMVAASRPGQPVPAGTEERLARFTELVATAVSNATMRGELVASRARVIAAADDARRRIERDLHDGAQQQLVTLALAMRSTEGRIPTGQEQLKAEVGGFADRVTSVVEELREMSRGIHPAILSEGGLSPALEALALRSAVPVMLNVRHEQRLPDAVEVAAYYVASEALTNASKHADASRVEIDLHLDDASLRLSICDDGGGGADPSRGSGLIGLKDRVEALGGTIDVESPHGRGTRLQVAIPVPADSSAG